MSAPLKLVSISRGAEFVLDMGAFPDAAPRFAYVDDVGASAQPLYGLIEDGRVALPDQPPFMWLSGPRDCLCLAVDPRHLRDGRASFRSLAVGEFCLEIYYLRPEGGETLLYQGDFCFK